MPLKPQLISHDILISTILQDLQLEIAKCDERIAEAIIAEYLRYSISISGARGEPIHINRIMSRIRKQTSFLLSEASDEWQSIKSTAQESEKEAKDPLANILDRLLIIRDVEHIGNGFYVPTPLRIVELPHSGALVVGGIPTQDATRLLGKTVLSVGIIRFIKQKESNYNSVLKQPFVDWMGYNSEPVQDWLRRYLEAAVKNLSAGAATMSFEVYDPAATSTNLQYYRWIDCQNWSGTDKRLYLCRTKMKPRRYWLGLLQKRANEVRALKEVDVSLDDVRRLRYGFDYLANRSTFAQISQSDREIIIQVYNHIPEQENRFLIGFLSVSSFGSRLPLKYCLPKDFLFDVVNLLSNLGVKLRGDLVGIE